MRKLKFDIKLDIEIPDHTQELNTVEKSINEIKKCLNNVRKRRLMNDEIHTSLYERTALLLFYVGKLSESVFKLEDEVERKAFSLFSKTPELAKKAFDDYYYKLHYRYDLLKNRCFKIFEDLDKEYIKKYKKYPPNWKI